MKMNPYRAACVLFGALLMLGSVPAFAQLKIPGQKPPAQKPAAKKAAPEKPAAAEDPLGRHIEALFKKFGGWTLCIVEDTPVAEIRAEVVREAKLRGAGDPLKPEEVEVAISTRYPCPFSPYRDELARASAKDIEGVWLFPESSQFYRYGPKSPEQPGGKAVAVKCEIVGYYAGGEFRNGIVRGEEACPFAKAADLQPARAAPRTINWAMPGDGRVLITRPDTPGLAQEWEVFVVKKPFGMHQMDFKEGDLVAFLRKEKGNDLNAATEFRHLQRLP